MNRHYDNYLCKKYPILYRDRNAPMQQTCMCWGFSIGNGWFNLINQLSRMIDATLDNHVWGGNAKAKDGHFEAGLICIIDQVKEKYGTLRFYYHLEHNPNVDPNDIDEEYSKQCANEISGLVSMAEVMSAHICEICGNQGKLYSEGWAITRCKEHLLE